jgi:hypothetical protein
MEGGDASAEVVSETRMSQGKNEGAEVLELAIRQIGGLPEGVFMVHSKELFDSRDG